VVAHSGELPGFRVFGIRRVEDGFGGPDSHVSICIDVVSLVFGRGALRKSSAGEGERTSGGRD
jgi:hypothetical protein